MGDTVTRLRCRNAMLPPLLMGLVLLGCASARRGGVPGAEPRYGAASAEAAVARFLDAAGERDYRAMARLFGTAEGAAERRWGRAETEQRMFVLAGLLSHRGYRLRPFAAGEENGAARWIAELTGTLNGDISLPFTLVSYRGRWFVERIRTEALSGRRQRLVQAPAARKMVMAAQAARVHAGGKGRP